MLEKTLIDPYLLGQKIKELRSKQGLSQKALCQNFMSTRALQKIEKGETIPTVEILVYISNQLQIDMFDLILSSRIPYYLQFKYASIQSLFAAESTMLSPEQFTYLENMIDDLSKMTLPYHEKVKLQTTYALMLTFLVERKEEAALLLKQHLKQCNFSIDPPTDTDYFAVAGYIRLEENNDALRAFLADLEQYPHYVRFPTVAYSLTQHYLKHGNYQKVIQIAKQAIQGDSVDKLPIIIAFLYGQMALAGKALLISRASHYGNQGLRILSAFQYEDEFKMLRNVLEKEKLEINVSYQPL